MGQHVLEISCKATKTMGVLRRNLALAPRHTVTCMLFIFLFIIDILFTYFLSDLDIDSKQVVYICFKILLEE